MAQLARVFAPQAEDWVLEFQPRQTQVVKTGSDTTAKRSATGVSVAGPRSEMPRVKVGVER